MASRLGARHLGPLRPPVQTLAAATLVAALLGPCAGVDQTKFRTCEQGSFCRRYRKYVKRIESSGGSEFAHALDAASVEHTGHLVKAKILSVHNPEAKPLLLSLKWFRDSVEGRCGILRMHVTEEAPLHARFQLRDGDVVLKEEEFAPDQVELSQPDSASTRLKSTAPGGCEVTIRHRPFELDFIGDGQVLQKINSRHLMNFERYRVKEAPPHSGLTDATDVESDSLWQESFGGHSDSKPRGPAAVALDVSFESAPDIMGLAEHATGLNLGANGFDEPYRFYNLDVFEYALDVPMALYGAVPMVTALHRWPGQGGSSGAAATTSGFFFPNPSEGFVKVDAPKQGGLFTGSGAGGATSTWWLFESGVVDAFLFAGPTPHAVLQQYHTVTGLPRLPPLCTVGKHQSRWNYVDIEDSLGVNRKFDQHDIPYDVLWLDIEHTDGKKYFTWHPTHFDKPDKLLDGLEQSKRKLVTIIDPHIKSENGYGVYTKLKELDFFTKTHSGELYDGWCWPGTSSYPDFCDPQMRDQWAKFFSMDYYPHNRPDLYTWNDMNEPSVFNGPEVTMPRDNLHKCHTGSFGVEHRDVHNVYGFYHHMATVQGQLERAPNVRPFVLTRSFFAGSHRNGAVWTGDNMARWGHLARSVPMLVSLCLCGISFAGADVPGFFFDPEPELFRRWHQLGIWYPFYRGHAHLETKRREPWMLGDGVTAMVREQVSVRYQLLPTWYTLFAEWALAGWPILRPLWYHNLEDEEAFKESDHHFLVGEFILVYAITQASQSTANLYLPGGFWYDFWDAKSPRLAGGRHSLQLDEGHVPVYVREGHVLFKKMRRRRSTGAMVADPYSVFVFGAQARGRLYIDDGHSHDYKQGAFIYDEVEFDGAALRSRPAPAFPHGLAAKGLPSVPKRHLRVERAVFHGLPQRPRGARLVEGAKDGAQELFQVGAVQASDGSWVATVKKPTCLLGAQWSLELTF